MFATLATAILPWFGACFQVQLSRLELVPPEPFSLGGYTARGSKQAAPGGDPLYVSVVRLRQDANTIIIVSCDLLTIPESLAEGVANGLRADEKLFLAATHTHCAPDSQSLNSKMTFGLPGIAKFDQTKLSWYVARISQAIQDARSSVPTTMRSVGVDSTHFFGNRGRRKGAWPDTMLARVWATPEPTGSAPPLNLMAWYSAHAVFYGSDRNQTSRDWPGALAEALETPVSLVGAIGDASPRAEGTTPQERIANFAISAKSALANSLLRGGRSSYVNPEIGWAEFPIQLEPVAPNPEFARLNVVPQSLADAVVRRFAPTSASIRAFRIGKVCVVGVPGEPTSALGRRIRDFGKGLGFDFVLTTSHVNGWIGYILESEDYARGGYEASLALHGSTTAQRVFEASVRAMTALAYPSRGVKSVPGSTKRQ